MDRLIQLEDFTRAGDQDLLRTQAREIVASLRGSLPPNQQALNQLVKDLPSLSEDDLSSLGHLDSQCPICIVPFLSLLAEEEMAQAMDSPAHPPEELGVTRLSQTCGHIFCRKDITKWVANNHDTCPTCRRRLLISTDTRPNEQIPDDDEISDSLFTIEQLMLNQLQGLDRFRDLIAGQQQSQQGPDDEDGGNEAADDNDEHPSAPSPPATANPDQSSARSRSPAAPHTTNTTTARSVSDEYFGMYS